MIRFEQDKYKEGDKEKLKREKKFGAWDLNEEDG